MSFSRKSEAEWLDENGGTPEEIASALRSITFVNQWFGGNRVHRLLLAEAARVSGAPRLHVLEAAAGFAIPLSRAALHLQRAGVEVHATLLDLHRNHLPSQWPAGLPPPKLLEGNALEIPLAEGSVDVVSCCLFLHHLSPGQAAAFLKEALRVARVAVLVNDVHRTRAHYGLARLFALADPSRLSRHDGPVSVRRAYTRAELAAMLHATGQRWTLRRFFLYRLGALLWVR